MRILAIETATSRASVAVEVDGELRAQESRTARDHAAALPDLTAAVLDAARVTPSQLDLIAVSSGPGSFTGLRVGFSFAKGLALATGARLVGVPTLEALAASSSVHDGRIVTLLDARRGELYRAEFEVCGPDLVCIRPAEALALADFLADPGDAAAFVGEGIRADPERILAALPAGSRILPDLTPSAAVVAKIGRRRLQSGGVCDPYDFEPTYVAAPNIRVPVRLASSLPHAGPHPES